MATPNGTSIAEALVSALSTLVPAAAPGTSVSYINQPLSPVPVQATSTSRTRCVRMEGNAAGCPRIDVCKDDIVFLRGLHYSWTKIARMLGISRQTLYRRLDEFEIPKSDYTPVSEHDLDQSVLNVKQSFPNDGEVMMQAHMLRIGVKVPRSLLRESIHRVDHSNTVSRRSLVTNRRVYSTFHPNHVWHIDGNHKLIRWRYVIHAGVDGYSRKIMFLKCANNNRAETVLEAFEEAVTEFGLPDCIRSDHGGENVAVWEYMHTMYGEESSCVITGSSTHNERVERLWRDVYRSVSSNFALIFSSLEDEQVLDPLNETDIYCLHRVFLSRINKHLKQFKNSWNMHALSTEGSMSPNQLFFEGLSALQEGVSTSNQNQTQSSLPIRPADCVLVPVNIFQPCNSLLIQLCLVDPLNVTESKSLYYQLIRLVGSHLQVCIECNM